MSGNYGWVCAIVIIGICVTACVNLPRQNYVPSEDDSIALHRWLAQSDSSKLDYATRWIKAVSPTMSDPSARSLSEWVVSCVEAKITDPAVRYDADVKEIGAICIEELNP